ncbi:MAG TPA: glycoside hydrolase family 25 protein, partial [Mobilitalea sp.]|nr:glycoside hydrolase family 25 protein [Mobilitalea sp.]
MSKKEFNKNFKKKSLRNNSKKSILYGIFTFFAVVSVIILSVFAVKLIKYGKDILSPSEKNILNDSDDVFLDLTDDDTNNNGDDIADKFVQENDGNINNDVSNMDELQNTDDSNTDVIDNINTEIKNDSNNGASDKKNEDIPIKEDKNDPQHENSEGIVIDVRDIEKAKDETDEITFGIDVSKWQGIIDWKEVKDAGVEFAIIRIGYRTQVDGKIIEDPYARYNLQQAQKYGIKLGAYFFSTAVNEKEAKEEAKWVVDFLAPYKITYPVVYNCEGFTDPENRQYGMTKEERTKLVIVFLDYIKESGYTPMFYAAKGELENNRDWDTVQLTKKYKIWVAQYSDFIDISNPKSTYSGSYDMWQYTSNGSVPGIKGPVDLNVAYFGYKSEAKAKDEKSLEEVTPDPAALIKFTEVNEIVTAKEVTNLR